MARGLAGATGRLIAPFAAVAIAGAAAPSASPVAALAALAGRYSDRFRNGLVDGTRFWSDDVVEIVPVDATHAYVRAELVFFNGHTCSLAGVATASGGGLVYRGLPDDIAYPGAKSCTLTLRRSGATLAWDDGGTCKAHCGERGGFIGGSLPWKSKRPITYLARLRGSKPYRNALAEWRTGMPAR